MYRHVSLTRVMIEPSSLHHPKYLQVVTSDLIPPLKRTHNTLHHLRHVKTDDRLNTQTDTQKRKHTHREERAR